VAAAVTATRKLAGRLVPAYVHDGDSAAPEPGLAGAVLRYRVMAYVVGTGLLILVFIGVPLQYGAGIPQVDAVVGPIHGFLYIVYLLTAVDLARRARFTLLQLGAMIGAGFLPFLAFVIEHRVMQRMAQLTAAGAANGAAALGDPIDDPAPGPA
jgi:integral membrane protein